MPHISFFSSLVVGCLRDNIRVKETGLLFFLFFNNDMRLFKILI